MRFMMVYQYDCDCGGKNCPGYSEEIRMAIRESPDAETLAKAGTEHGRVILVFPLKKATDLLGMDGSPSVALRDEGIQFTSDAQFHNGCGRSGSITQAPNFYMDPQAQSNPTVNPRFDPTPEKFSRRFRKGDTVELKYPEGDTYYEEKYGIPEGEYTVIERLKDGQVVLHVPLDPSDTYQESYNRHVWPIHLTLINWA